MIYLIKSSAFDEDNNLFFILKIGYTSDKGKDRRFTQYKLHNPSCKILYEIPDLTVDDEKRIQYYFRNLRYPDYGREWFTYSEEIIDFFENIGKHDIKSMPKSPMSERRDHYNIRKMVKSIVYQITEIPKDKRDNYIDDIIDELGSNLNSSLDVLEKIKSDYGASCVLEYNKFVEMKENKNFSSDPAVNQEVSSFLEKYDSLSTYYDKAKLLCNYYLSDDAYNLILSQISEEDDIRSHFTVLGRDRIKSLGYNATKIRSEIGVVTFDCDILINKIFTKFRVGDKLSSSEVKNMLANIYCNVSYSKLPKSTDLENYFILKEAKIVELSEDGSKKKSQRNRNH